MIAKYFPWNLNKIWNIYMAKRNIFISKAYFNKDDSSSDDKCKKSKKSVPVVKGLSEAVCCVPNTPVGPGAAKCADYKNPEYFCYHKYSFNEAEVELKKYRTYSQGSNKCSKK